MGNINIFVNYLATTKPRLSGYMPREHTAKIEERMNWFLAVMRPCIQRLIKVVVGPKAFGLEHSTGEELESTKAAFLN